MVWTGNNVFRNATQGMGLNENLFGALLDRAEGPYSDPWGYSPGGYIPPTRLTGDPISDFPTQGSPNDPTTTPPTGGGGTGGGTGGGGNNGETVGDGLGGVSDGIRGEDANLGAGTFDGDMAGLLGALGIDSGTLDSLSPGFLDTLGGLFSDPFGVDANSPFGVQDNLLGYQDWADDLGLLGGALGVATGSGPLGTLGTIAGSVRDMYSSFDAANQLSDPYGVQDDFDFGFLDALSGVANNLSGGFIGTSPEDQALAEAFGLVDPSQQSYSDIFAGYMDAIVDPYMQNQTPTQTTSSVDAGLIDRINSLENQLSTLDPDTAGYRSTQRQLDQALADAGFSTASGIGTTNETDPEGYGTRGGIEGRIGGGTEGYAGGGMGGYGSPF